MHTVHCSLHRNHGTQTTLTHDTKLDTTINITLHASSARTLGPSTWWLLRHADVVVWTIIFRPHSRKSSYGMWRDIEHRLSIEPDAIPYDAQLNHPNCTSRPLSLDFDSSFLVLGSPIRLILGDHSRQRLRCICPRYVRWVIWPPWWRRWRRWRCCRLGRCCIAIASTIGLCLASEVLEARIIGK
jgi:hypothetical protein